jgi:NAD+ kinase
MRLLLMSRIDSDETLAYTRVLGTDLTGAGFSVIYDTATARALGREGVPLASADPDAVVAIGGDGTILLCVQQMKVQHPLIGINRGEVGFLADLEPEEALSFLKKLRPGFPVERRMRIDLSINGEPLGTALNEAVIVTSRPAKMLRFSVMVDGVRAEQFRGDGLLISTPTGSTAYAMSAGGPIVDPRIEGFLLVPLAPYMLSSRPHMISSTRTLVVRLEASKPAHLVLDGQRTIDLGDEVTIEVTRSPDPAQFIDVNRNFFSKVEQKLRNL